MRVIKFKDVLNYITEPIIKGAYVIHFEKKVYIGGSNNVLKRLNQHRCLLRSKKHLYYDNVKGFDEHEVYFSIHPTDYYLELEALLIEKYRNLGIALNRHKGDKIKHMPREKYTKVKVIKITETQHNTLKKMKGYKVDVCRFIRDAIKEKIDKEYADLIPKTKKEYTPF